MRHLCPRISGLRARCRSQCSLAFASFLMPPLRPTCTEFGNGPFLGDLGAVLGVLLGDVLRSLPAGGEIFLRAIGGADWAEAEAERELRPRTTRRKTGGQQSKDERQGDRRGKQTHDLANPGKRGRSQAPPSSLLLSDSQGQPAN
jgi:hypothetical protein